MKPSILAVRAIASEFARRLFTPVAIFVGIAVTLIIGLMIWLVTIDLWWLLLALPIMLIVVVALAVMAITGLIIWLVSPVKTKEQKRKVAAFVEKTQYISEVTTTPKFILLFRMVRDVLIPSKEGFVQTVIGHSTSLKRDFTDLAEVFAE